MTQKIKNPAFLRGLSMTPTGIEPVLTHFDSFPKNGGICAIPLW